MHPLVMLLGIILAALALIALFVGAERWLRRPGLAFLLTAGSLLVGAALGYADGKRLLPTVFVLQAIGFFYISWWRFTEARNRKRGAAEA